MASYDLEGRKVEIMWNGQETVNGWKFDTEKCTDFVGFYTCNSNLWLTDSLIHIFSLFVLTLSD